MKRSKLKHSNLKQPEFFLVISTRKYHNTEWMEACKEIALLFGIGKDFFWGTENTQEKFLTNLTLEK